MTLPILDWITVGVSVYWFISNLSNIIKEFRYVIYYMFFVFYVFPLVLDCILGMPDYEILYNGAFAYGQKDVLTRCIYDLLMLAFQYFILKYKYKKLKQLDVKYINGESEYPQSIKIFFIINMFMAPLIAYMNDYPSRLFFELFARENIGWRWAELNLHGYTYVEMFTYTAIVSGLLFIFEYNPKRKKYLWVYKLLCIIMLYINMCLEGKRAILFFTAIVILLIFILRIKKENIMSKRRARRKFFIIVCVAAIMAAFAIVISYNVKTNSRGMNLIFNRFYVGLRVDFFRDDRVRTAIYSLLYPQRQKILDYPMQTILCWPFLIFPINYFARSVSLKWPSYTYYISALLENKSVEEVSPFMTPSIYAELISNMGIILGSLVMAFLIWKLIVLARKNGYPYNVMIITLFIMLQMFDISYISIYIEFVLISILIKKYKLVFGKRK